MIKNLIYKFFNHIVYLLSRLFPRSKNIWVFIGWHIGFGMEIFADNTKYLFLHVANNHKGIRPVWLAKDQKLAELLRSRGYISYYQYSVPGIWCALRAGTTIIDAYLQTENFRLTGKTRLIQLLHGKGMKKGGYAQPPLRRQDYIFSPSNFVSGILHAEFVQKTPIVVTGYPRTDVFFKKISGSDIGVDKKTETMLSDNRYKKRFLYAPTFRRGQKTLDLESSLDLPRLSSWLHENNFLLLVSLHPKYRDQARNISRKNLHFVEDSDIYPILPKIDVLITDYSSIFTDFLLLNRPMIFYPYDLKEYSGKEGLLINYDDYTPGPKVYTPEELLVELKKISSSDEYGPSRNKICSLYHAFRDGNSSERIMNVSQK